MIRASVGLALAVASLTTAFALSPSVVTAQSSMDGVAVPIEREAYLMGTRARLLVYEANRTAALTALDAALQVLEDTEAELSTWRTDSAISSLNRSPVAAPWIAAARLCAMFEEVYRWSRATHGAFDPAIGALAVAWGIHATGRVPSPDEIAIALTQSGLERLSFDRTACTLTRSTDVTIDVGAFGKGEALDRASAALGNVAWMIDLGGQVLVNGVPPDGGVWTIDLAHPARRDRRLLQVRISHGSLSTSGGSERDQTVHGQRVGHILNPRTGHPAPFNGSVTVWHERGLVADILSTALYVMGPEAGMAWAERRGLSALYLIPEDDEVRVLATTSFEQLLKKPGH